MRRVKTKKNGRQQRPIIRSIPNQHDGVGGTGSCERVLHRRSCDQTFRACLANMSTADDVASIHQTDSHRPGSVPVSDRNQPIGRGAASGRGHLDSVSFPRKYEQNGGIQTGAAPGNKRRGFASTFTRTSHFLFCFQMDRQDACSWTLRLCLIPPFPPKATPRGQTPRLRRPPRPGHPPWPPPTSTRMP